MKVNKLIKAFTIVGLAVSLIGGNTTAINGAESKTIVVGATTSPHAIILKHVKKEYKKQGYTLKIKEFSDYPQIDPSTSDGSLDANYFQHQPYLTSYNKDKNYKKGDDGYLVSAGAIHFEPLGIYSENNTSLDTIKDGATIAIPNDASNEVRALLLLRDQGLITLKKNIKATSTKATTADVVKNKHKLDLVEIDGAQIASKLRDVDYAVINGNYALDAKVTDKVIVTEDASSEAAKTYANVIAVKQTNQNRKAVKALVKILKSEKTKKWIKDRFNGSVLPAE